jgi:hypothetical protein
MSKFFVEKENSLIDLYEMTDEGVMGVEFKGFALKCNLLSTDLPKEAHADVPNFMDLYLKQAA